MADGFNPQEMIDRFRERANAVEEVRQQFADLAIAAAEQVIERSLDKDTHKEIIEKVLEESSQIGEGR